MDDLRQRILGSRDTKVPAVMMDIPEWGVAVGLRRLSLPERLAFETENGALEDIDRKKEREAYNRWVIRYVIATTCTAEGERLFHPEDEGDLGNKSATSIERLALGAVKVNIVSAEEIAELGKSFGGARNGASPSDSPATSA
jgi:hypothetical protein